MKIIKLNLNFFPIITTLEFERMFKDLAYKTRNTLKNYRNPKDETDKRFKVYANNCKDRNEK